METSPIDKILEARKQAEPASSATTPEVENDKFFSILVGEAIQEHFLELQFRDGTRACFSYTDLLWFNYDPESGVMDLEFGGFLITVKGRGMYPRLFQGIKSKRVAWIKEADSDFQDHKGNEIYIGEILITPPKSFVEAETKSD